MFIPVSDTEIIAPNFKRNLSGVTSTIVQLIPVQRKMGVPIASMGPGLPEGVARVRWRGLLGLWRKPANRPFRIWHARRNNEMIAGIIMRSVLRMKLRLVFTSAAQRDHKPLTKWLIRRMDAVIATSNRSASYLKVPHIVNMHGIDLQRFHPATSPDDQFSASGFPGKYAVGCFGRVRHQKGTDLFVDAMIELLPKYPDWTAVIAGRTTADHQEFEDNLRSRIERAGLSGRIIFLGEVNDIRVWYRRLSLYVAPSRNEGFGLTPLEAMASQTAIVASDAGAYAEMIVEGFNGSVVPAGDGDAMIRALEPYLAQPDLAAEHGKNGYAYVHEHFPLEREAAAINAVYDQVFYKG